MHGRKHLHVLQPMFRRDICVQLRHVIRRHKFVVEADKFKVAVRGKLRHLPVVNAVGVAHNGAYLRLAEDVFQPYDGHFFAADNVLQNRARPDGRKLVHVADENQTATAGHCF